MRRSRKEELWMVEDGEREKGKRKEASAYDNHQNRSTFFHFPIYPRPYHFIPISAPSLSPPL